MKQISFLFAVLFLLSSTLTFAAPPPWAGSPGGPGDDDGGDEPPPENLIIIVDPGHGGTAPGTTQCPGLYEKDANLDIALKLETVLEAVGYDVRLTRTDDSTLSNNDRYTFANSVGGNALVSIHLNGSTDRDVNGTQGFGSPKWKKDEAFTNVVHQALVNTLGVNDRGTDTFASGVLLKSEMPATIQEAVFISNEGECALLTDKSGERQQQIAEALATGVRNWFEN